MEQLAEKKFTGRTPLYVACQKNHLEVVIALKQAGADAAKSNNNGNTPENIASSLGFADILQELHDYTDNAEMPNEAGLVPLHKTCQNGHYEVAESLLDNGCNLEPTTYYGDIPLHLAARAGNLKIGELLLKRGHSVKALNNAGETPLDSAHQGGHVDFSKLLTQQGVYINNDLRNKPAQVSCNMQYETQISRLMNHIITEPERALRNIRSGHYDVHYQDLEGKTALHHTASQGSLDTVKGLVECGCFLSPVTVARETPADVALKNGHQEVYKFLLQIKQPIQSVGNFHSGTFHTQWKEMGFCQMQEDQYTGMNKIMKKLSGGALEKEFSKTPQQLTCH